jgi:hypothetical protein
MIMRNTILIAATAACFAFANNAQAAAYWCQDGGLIHNFSADGTQYYVSSQKPDGTFKQESVKVTVAVVNGFADAPPSIAPLNGSTGLIKSPNIQIYYFPRYKVANATMTTEAVGVRRACTLK